MKKVIMNGKAERFNGACMAEIFRMEKQGRCEYYRYNVCLEVHKSKDTERMTLWLLSVSDDCWYEFVTTSDYNVVSELLNIINTHKAWEQDKGYMEVCFNMERSA